ncbi:FAD binding domain-containing protein [Cryptosporangium arvum]|uniref:Aerobic-type carbon monoxide dehydrogenase, middle subunit CoxM/CutM-like protein n=1 Tax=Cryptosporangium arvum DSM 44712 TaxID=927661 RepID=A0A011A0I3_9ACTN|nr:FAD binding domain-containing protein [Cryptosporangium arvum]EXG83002.1 aerobic-type carbon monoxide dehydrogenase, middle subunit CoxM/CutM-like protein [Cryptosporangium arvum DSM 44712]
MFSAVHVPRDPAAAAQALREGGTVLAGGTYLMPRFNERAFPPTSVVSLRRAGLDGVEADGATVRLGAATTLATLEADERLAFLRPCLRAIASPPVRGLATVGGNLFVPQPYGDLAVALLALGASIEVHGGGRTPLDDGVPAGDLVTAVTFAVPDSFRFYKATRRRHNSAAIVSVAVNGDRIALGGVAPRPLRAHAAEAVLRADPGAVGPAAEAMREHLAPADDAYASAWYRHRVFPVHFRRALLGR